jgi:hypothetical protein
MVIEDIRLEIAALVDYTLVSLSSLANIEIFHLLTVGKGSKIVLKDLRDTFYDMGFPYPMWFYGGKAIKSNALMFLMEDMLDEESAYNHDSQLNVVANIWILRSQKEPQKKEKKRKKFNELILDFAARFWPIITSSAINVDKEIAVKLVAILDMCYQAKKELLNGEDSASEWSTAILKLLLRFYRNLTPFPTCPICHDFARVSCSRCKTQKYCSTKCMNQDEGFHKIFCGIPVPSILALLAKDGRVIPWSAKIPKSYRHQFNKTTSKAVKD